MRALRWPALWLLGGAALVLLVVVLSVDPQGRAVAGGVNDKLGHVLAYAVLAVWFGGVMRRARWALVAAGLLALGAGLELVQALLPGRHPGLDDLLANGFGTAAGLALAALGLDRWCTWVEARCDGAG